MTFFTLGRTIGLLIIVAVVIVAAVLLQRLDTRLSPAGSENDPDPSAVEPRELDEATVNVPKRIAKVGVRRHKHRR